jgi:ligand-binding sensor domain-containing protein/signal transduction histidine kinase
MIAGLTVLVAFLVPGARGAVLPAGGDAGPEWFVLNTWQQRHGLPENTIRTLMHTRDGYLWIATHGGVARFDGANFTVFDERSRDPLREIEVQAMVEGNDGSVWMGTHGAGLSRYKDGRFTHYTTKEGLGNDFVLSLCRDGQGGIWAATDGGVSRFADGRFRNYTTADGLLKNQVHGLYVDRDGSIWMATRNGGLSRYRDGKFHTETIAGVPDSVIVRGVLRDRAGALWVATYAGLHRVKDGQTTHYTTAEGLSSNRLYTIHEDGEGTLWVGTDRGLDRVRDGKIHAFAPFAGRAFTAIGSSQEGCVWAGSGWLACLLPSQFTNYSTDNGLPHNYVTTFTQDSQGDVWVATIVGLARVRDGQVAAVTSAHGLPAAAFTAAVAQDHQGTLWVGTDFGLYRSREPLSDDRGMPRFVKVENQPTPAVQARSLYVDRAGTVWIASVREGLVRYRDGAFTVYTTRDGLLHDAVRGIREDGQGNLWVGTREGLNRLRDGKFTAFTVRDGLAHATVEALHVDGEGALWIATRDGVNRLKDGRFTTVTVHDGLLASYVNAFAEDRQGNMWMTSIRGVFRVKKQELDELADGKRRSVTPFAYGTEHGMLSTRATASIDRSIYQTRDGRIWFAMVRGASVIDPGRLRFNRQPPPIHIEEVRVDGQVLGASGTLEAPPGEGELAIRWAGVGFVAPEKMRFRYRLQGHDADWVEAENRRAAYYTRLPPGHYTFRVIAANNDGVWNPVGDGVALHLRPHWYQTFVVRAAALLLVLLAMAGAYRLRVRALVRRRGELERHVAERTAELGAANKELEAYGYSVSHDLRQPLRSLEGFSRALLDRHAGNLNAEGQEFLQHMERASRRMDQLIEAMLVLSRVRQGELRRSAVDLGALAREIAGDLQRRHPARRVTVEIAPDLLVSADGSLIRIVLENLLGNAWKFTSKVADARVEVGRLPRPGQPPAYFVRDNGAGFDPAYVRKLFTAFQRLHAATEFEGSGIGLATVARVIQRHGGEVWAEGTEGAGATFFFTLPDAPAA